MRNAQPETLTLDRAATPVGEVLLVTDGEGAARALDFADYEDRMTRLLARHILPNTLAPLIVQGSYIFASAMLIEAGLSFLGAGVPPETPSWGNIIAQGRQFFQIAPWTILIPGCFLATAVLAVNLLGDGLRDRLDPRLARRM